MNNEYMQQNFKNKKIIASNTPYFDTDIVSGCQIYIIYNQGLSKWAWLDKDKIGVVEMYGMCCFYCRRV